MDFVVKRQLYTHKGKSIFQLTLVYQDEPKYFRVVSSLPAWLIAEVPMFELTINEQSPHFDIQEVVSKLNHMAYLINQKTYAKYFYYPMALLDSSGKLKLETQQKYASAVNNFIFKQTPYISSCAAPFESLFLTEKLFSFTHGKPNKVFLNSIERQTFESNFQTDAQKHDYIELYFSIKRFIEVEVQEDPDRAPSFQAALNEKGQVLMAFATHAVALKTDETFLL